MTIQDNWEPDSSSAPTPPIPKTITIAVIGDVHDLWDSQDSVALKHLGVDLVLLVGDFGNESVGVVRTIAAIDLPKAAIFGNHDAWYTASEWGQRQCPYDRCQEDRVQQQIDLLGEAHVGYSKRDFPALGLSVVGLRPFSWGGPHWKNEQFYRDRYGIHNFSESVAQIMAAVQAAEEPAIIFLGHCGPAGLGSRPEDPCGRDWQPLGGDFGDPDSATAIAQTLALGKSVPLVTFGHMHHRLRHTAQPRIPIWVSQTGTVYLNAAVVPRIVHGPDETRRNFSLVTLTDGHVSRAEIVWYSDQFCTIVDRRILYSLGVADSECELGVV